MNKKLITKTLIISLMMIFMCCQAAYCSEDGTVRMKIDNSTPWTNINVSESYEECESLNSTTSTLGTAALKAHLTTDYDWNAMAIFSVSQYGRPTGNSPNATSTTKNKSGIYDIGANYVQTTSLLNTSTSTSTGYLYGLYDESGNIKKYVNKINPSTGEDQLGRTAIAYIVDGGTYSWWNSYTYKGTDTGFPVGIKLGLFGVVFGSWSGYGAFGGPSGNVTFRPVIWN